MQGLFDNESDLEQNKLSILMKTIAICLFRQTDEMTFSCLSRITCVVTLSMSVTGMAF